DKHSFVIPRLTQDGETIEVGHTANMSPFSNAPLRCQVCHVETVSEFDLSRWESGEGWHRNNKGLIEIDDLDIRSRARHVNGTVDVDFDVRGPATSYRFNNTSFGYSLDHHPSYQNSSDRLVPISPYYYGVKGRDAPGATWKASTKTCSNVSCHLEQTTVQWTNPYRPYSKAECYQCHQYFSDPTKGENETMCLPHAPYDGCEDR
ncbi:MAG: CxxxxCH/CxxCH domain-containing protein, partial [Bacteroidota bacterium]